MIANFRVQCTLRVLLLVACIAVFLVLVIETSFYFTMTLVGLVVVLQTAGLIRYVEKTNRDLARFLDAIEYNDFTQSFANVSGGRTFGELRTAFAGVMRKFQGARSEKEAQFLYMRRVVQHIEIGLVAFEVDGTITLINDAALYLIHELSGKGAGRLPEAPTHLRQIPEALAEKLLALHIDDRALVRFDVGGETVQLLLHATQFMLRDTMYTLVSLHNIQSELDRQEIESWQKLARVLTHEIMNSITPIASLASTTGALFTSYRGEPDTAGSITGALSAIEKRSRGLMRFVESYRKLLRVPPPVVQSVRARDILERVRELVKPETEKRGIELVVWCDPDDVSLAVDSALIEQALINLLLNAVEAVAQVEHPCIDLVARRSGDKTILLVRDNGAGMSTEVLEKIFVPFFTTRKDGSGVGLSITRQIIHAHRGTIAVQSEPGGGTAFTIRL